MKKGNIWIGFGGFCGIVILIFDSKTALLGAKDGIMLCIQTVIPSLFPFFVLSGFVTGSFVGSRMPLLSPLGRLFRMPEGSESLLISAFLGGYPVGAQAIATACRNGQLSRPDAERMLAFCNNPGPAFLFGMAAHLFPQKSAPWLLWGILIISALMVARILPGPFDRAVISKSGTLDPAAVMSNSVKTMGCVCGWVVLFRVLICFTERWFLWQMPNEIRIPLIGLLELSNGCYELGNLQSIKLRFLICGCMLSFGGLCVTMQTISVTADLRKKYYMIGKILQMILCATLSIAIMFHIWIIILTIAVLFLIFSGKCKKYSSNPRKAIV